LPRRCATFNSFAVTGRDGAIYTEATGASMTPTGVHSISTFGVRRTATGGTNGLLFFVGSCHLRPAMADRESKQGETPDAPPSAPIKPGSSEIATAKGAAYASTGARAAPAPYISRTDEPAVMLRRSLMDDAEVLGADVVEVFVPGGKSKHVDVGPRTRAEAPAILLETAPASAGPPSAPLTFEVDLNAPQRPSFAPPRPVADRSRSVEKIIVAVLLVLLAAVGGVLVLVFRSAH
jgi:hypothetical protein